MIQPIAPFSSDACRRNLRWYLVYRTIFEFSLWYPVWILFLSRGLGLSFTKIMGLDFFFQIAVVFLEIPTGVLADTIGRRWALFWAAVMMAIAVGLLGLAVSAWWVLASFSFWALGVTMLNGADAALVYESLLAVRREEEFPRILGKFMSLVMVGTVVASILGGWLAGWSYRLTMFGHAALFPIAVFAALRLREPPRGRTSSANGPREVIRGMRALVARGRHLRVLLAYSAALWLVIILAIVYQQPLLVEGGLTVARIGWFYAAAMLIAASGPFAFMWVRARVGMAGALAGAGLTVTASCLLLAKLPGLWIMLPLVAIQFVASGIGPVIIDGMNRTAGPGNRATVLSLRSVVTAGVVGPAEIISGWFADRVPLRRIFLAVGVALPLVVGLLMWLWRRSPELAGEEIAFPGVAGASPEDGPAPIAPS